MEQQPKKSGSRSVTATRRDERRDREIEIWSWEEGRERERGKREILRSTTCKVRYVIRYVSIKSPEPIVTHSHIDVSLRFASTHIPPCSIIHPLEHLIAPRSARAGLVFFI